MKQEISVGMVSLGCPKNLVDSEIMLGLLLRDRFRLAPDVTRCDVAVINTCSFIHDARTESMQAIRELAKLKSQQRIRALIVCGCLGQLQPRQLQEEIPQVDAVVGTGEYPHLGKVVKEVLAGRRPCVVGPPRYIHDHLTPRILLTPKHSAYVKVAEGCDHPCSFCVIPRLRGSYRSRPLSSIVQEVEHLAQEGVKEINLISQDTSYYGWDMKSRSLLPELLRRLNRISAIRWIRLLYLHPRHLTQEILEAIAENEKVCRYIDCPLQHINDRILTHMRRGVRHSDTIRLAERVRRLIPDGVFRTAFIVGYPGETEKEFQELLDFVEKMKFERVGVFTYSLEPGTPASKSKHQVPERVKRERFHRLMSLQQRISREWLKRFVGKTVETLVEGKRNSSPCWHGRAAFDAPEVDGQVRFQCLNGRVLNPGDFVSVCVTRSQAYDLVGVVNE